MRYRQRLLGYIAGVLMLLFMEKFGPQSIASIVVFELLLLDTVVALIRRFINKRPLFLSDRGHIYAQLIDRGWGLLKTVKTCYLLGISIALIRFRWATLAFIAIMAVSLLIVWRRGFLTFLKMPRTNKSAKPTALFKHANHTLHSMRVFLHITA